MRLLIESLRNVLFLKAKMDQHECLSLLRPKWSSDVVWLMQLRGRLIALSNLHLASLSSGCFSKMDPDRVPSTYFGVQDWDP